MGMFDTVGKQTTYPRAQGKYIKEVRADADGTQAPGTGPCAH